MEDYEKIAEITMYSMGFMEAKILSAKIIDTYKLCSEQLSSQHHYDFGMRTVKSVLTAVGNLRLKYPKEIEARLVLKGISDINLPKLVAQDVPLFEGIISDMFPGVKILKPGLDPLIETLKVVCKEMNLQPTDFFIEKTLQIYEMILVRHGLMIVGEALCGKTCSYQCLAAALTKIKENKPTGFIEKRVEYKIFNPKAITRCQLFGCFDPVTSDWSDGVVAKSFREMASSSNDDRKWIIFDGPVDAVWIENMNTVLDDNKKLCLTSGEIIKMTPLMNILFEPGSLEQASPATVSRCGMVLFESKQLGWRPLKDSFLKRLTAGVVEEQQQLLEDLFEWIIPANFDFLRRECKSFVPTSELHQFQSFVRLFSSVLRGDAKVDDETAQSNIWLQIAFLFSTVWSLGGTLVLESREKFDTFFRGLLSGTNKEFPRCKSFNLTKNQLFPERGSVFDYICDKKDGKWVVWMDIVDRDLLKIPQNAKINDLIIPTDETARQQFFLNTCLKNDYPFLFVGPTGTGKSAITMNWLMSLPKDKFIPIVINFSARTTASLTQDIIMSKLDRRKRGVFGPSNGKKCVVFIDDLSMPQKELYGAQPPIELLRQWVDHKNWYDLKDTSKLALEDLLFIGAMGTTGGGCTEITSRLVRHMSILAIDSFDDNIIKKIFTAIADWHFSKDYKSEILRWTKPLIQATLDIYKSAIGLFPPTPVKFHYVFNLRDFSRVVRGLLLIPNTHLTEPNKLMRLWVHETYRVFYDRLLDDADRQEFFQLVSTTVQENFKIDLQKLLGHLATEGQALQDVNISNLIFGDYMERDPEADPDSDKVYDEVPEMNELLQTTEGFLEEYNLNIIPKMDLVLFKFATEHISRISRVLKQPNSHALLIGINGSGRQSFTRLAAFMSGYELVQIEVSKKYGMHEWREDLKKVLKQAGNEGKPTVFLFSDEQLKDENLVEDINMILNTGDIPSIFRADELGEILDKMQMVARKEFGKKMETSTLTLYNIFIDRVRRNLHIVLAMSPVGDGFRARLRMFPSFINCCTIDWYMEWPDEALVKVAQKFLSNLDTEAPIRESCVLMCQKYHESARALSTEYYELIGRKNYVTNISYLEFILTFKFLFGKKREELEEQRQRYINGLDRLAFVADQVNVIEDELNILRPKLLEMTKAMEGMLLKIAADTLEAEAIKERLALDEALALEAAAAAQAIKDECENDLAEAIPALEAALSALDTLKPADITFVKSMKNPPKAIKMVLEAICVMFSIKPEKKMDGNGKPIEDYWGPSLRMLGDFKFREALKEYDKDNIPPAAMKKIRDKFITNPEFDPIAIKNVCSAFEGLIKWVRALDVYDRVIKIVGPKKLRLAEAEAELQRQLDRLREKRAQLQEILDKLQALKDEYERMIQKKRDLEHQIELWEQKLPRAKKLVEGLSGEKSRWIEGAAELADQLYNTVGNVLICAGIVAYLGPYTAEFRHESSDKWQKLCIQNKIPCSPVFSMIKILGIPEHIRNWHAAGLPIDDSSIDNGIIVTNARKWALMIDPQAIASKWVRNFERDNMLEVITPTDPGYIDVLENAIQLGLPVLMDNVGEEIDPALEPVLFKQTFLQDDVLCIKIGENVVEYHKDFRFYLITHLRNPHYLPEIAVKVTLLNFMITPPGLQGQLLAIVVAKEEPDLEEQKNLLAAEDVNNKNLLKEIEDNILEVLSGAKANIFEDENATHILTTSNEQSQEIMAKQEIVAGQAKKCDETRSKYTPVALHASTLFFCISEMANIDPMYQYSLTWFINLYTNSIANSRKSYEFAVRVTNLNEHFTSFIYRNICRSLFEKDKLVFSLVLCVALMKSKGEFDMESWWFLLTKGVPFDNPHPNPAAQWLSEKSWAEVVRLSQIYHFEALQPHVIKHSKHWKEIFDSSEPQDKKLPAPFWKMNDLQRILILRCFRPDKLVPALQAFITTNLGEEFIDPPGFDLESSFNESNSGTPLLFVLSSGADPTLDLFKFAGDKGFSGNRMQSLSLGKGQGPIARKMIEESTEEGNWVILQNCHLATSWMPELEIICQDVITAETTHSGFRLWLTSYPSPHFPVTVLQNSVKMTNEAPQGLRANLMRSYTGNPISDGDFLSSVRANVKAFRSMVFGLSFFHAVVRERRRFGSLGWNNIYEFSESDFRISLMQLQTFLNDNLVIPYDGLVYLTGESNYGGSVIDEQDRRLLKSLLSTFYTRDIVEKEDYVFSPSGTYHVPGDADTRADYATCLAYIKDLPINPSPEVYGLHENANIAKGNQETKQLLERVLLTQTELKSGGDGSDSSGIIVINIAQDILKKLPDEYDLEAVMEKYPVDYLNSMNTVLRQELIRYNRLLKVVRETLTNVQKAINGSVMMSTELEEVFNSMLVGKVPQAWTSKSYLSLKPLGSYIADLLLRLTFLKSWIEKGAPNVVWISGFFFTQSFLTGVTQNYARKYKIPIDQLAFEFVVTQFEKSSNVRPKDGAYCRGMFLEGARWDRPRRKLAEAYPKTLFDPIPVIWFKPGLKENFKEKPSYDCPMYKTSARGGTFSASGLSANFILYMKLHSDKPQKHWINRGTACLCQLDD